MPVLSWFLAQCHMKDNFLKEKNPLESENDAKNFTTWIASYIDRL
jgi:hypothetical protein